MITFLPVQGRKMLLRQNELICECKTGVLWLKILQRILSYLKYKELELNEQEPGEEFELYRGLPDEMTLFNLSYLM